MAWAWYLPGDDSQKALQPKHVKMFLSVKKTSLLIPLNIAANDRWPLNYIFTPKNACSSLKASFLGMAPPINNPDTIAQRAFNEWHNEFAKHFCRTSINDSKAFFCVTRNPYERLISAYVDKIHNQRDLIVWGKFCKRYNLDMGTRLTLLDFLQILERENFPETLDPHFRPQFFVNHARAITPRFIGRVERMKEISEFLSRHGFSFLSYRPHKRTDLFNKSDLTSKQTAAIRRIYTIDFYHYQYDPDPRCNYSPPFIEQDQFLSPTMRLILGIRNISARMRNYY